MDQVVRVHHQLILSMQCLQLHPSSAVLIARLTAEYLHMHFKFACAEAEECVYKHMLLLQLAPDCKIALAGTYQGTEIKFVRAYAHQGLLFVVGRGLPVMQHLQGQNGVEQRPLQHVIFLSGAFADAPARQKWALFLAVAAYLGCGYCLFQGQRFGSNMAFRGYLAKTKQSIIFEDISMHARDKRLRLSHK